MSDAASVTRALDDLEATQAELAGVAARTDDARRLDLVRLRRLLSTKIALIGPAVEPLLEDDPANRAEFRRVYSAIRSAAALHQADWPAGMLGEDHAGYGRSAQGVREANRTFVAWLRAYLATRAVPR